MLVSLALSVAGQDSNTLTFHDPMHTAGSAGRSLRRDLLNSSLLSPGQFELIFFNNLYTQTANFDDESQKENLEERSTYFTSSLSLFGGVTRSINAGLDLFLKSVRNEDLPSSPFSLFSFSESGESRTALASIAAKMKFPMPLGEIVPSVQTALNLPVGKDMESRPSLAHDDIEWWSKLLYDHEWNRQFRLYAESGHNFRFAEDMVVYSSPIKAIFSYLPKDEWTLYVPLGITPTWSKSGWSSYFIDPGFGVKYFLRDGLELETLVTQFLFGKASGAGITFNLGVRWVH